MKKIAVLVLCFCFLCSLFACASQPQPGENSSADPSSQGVTGPGSDTDVVSDTDAGSDASSDPLTDSAAEESISSDAGPESDVSSDDVAGQPPEEPEEVPLWAIVVIICCAVVGTICIALFPEKRHGGKYLKR